MTSLIAVLLAATTSARAAPPAVELQERPHETWWAPAAVATAGFTTAFIAHESGHVIANLVLGNPPHLETTHVLGFLPFPVISPRLSCWDTGCARDGGSVLPSGGGASSSSSPPGSTCSTSSTSWCSA